MNLHNYFKMSARTVQKFIIEELGFDKESGFKNVKVKKIDRFSFSVKVFPILNNGEPILPFEYEIFDFIPYEDTFCFENLDEGVDVNESKVYDEVWRTFLRKERKEKNPEIKLKKINCIASIFMQ